MAFNRSPFNGNGIGVSILKVIIAGSLLGVSSFLGKIIMTSDLHFDLITVYNLVQNPIIWVLPVAGVLGFLTLQSCIHGGKISIVISVGEGFIIITSVLLAYVILGEIISAARWIGIILIIIATIGLGHEAHKQEVEGYA